MKKLKKLPGIDAVNEAVENPQYEEKIGIYKLIGYLNEVQGESYGHFNIELFMGAGDNPSKWDIPKDWLKKIEEKTGVTGIVYPSFSHNRIAFLYTEPEDTQEIWDKSMEAFKELLDE